MAGTRVGKNRRRVVSWVRREQNGAGQKAELQAVFAEPGLALSAHVFPFPVEVRKWEGALALDFWPRSSLIASRWSPLHVVCI